jgi:hypothetical protein
MGGLLLLDDVIHHEKQLRLSLRCFCIVQCVASTLCAPLVKHLAVLCQHRNNKNDHVNKTGRQITIFPMQYY